MRKITIATEIEVPDGFEYVGFRVPKHGNYVCCDGETIGQDKLVSQVVVPTACFRKIEPPYEYPFPDVVKSGTWLAVDANGATYLFEIEPSIKDGEWHICRDGDVLSIERLESLLNIKFPVPRYTDWRQAKWQQK